MKHILSILLFLPATLFAQTAMDKFWSPIGHSIWVRWSSASKDDKGVQIPYDKLKGSPENPLLKDGYLLVFQDEFEGNSFDTLAREESYKVIPFENIFTNSEYGITGKYPKWIAEKPQVSWEKGHSCTLRPENSYIEDGKLKQKVVQEADNQYYSAVLNSNAQIKYGYFEAKIKNPKGKMIWPAFWLYKAGGGNGCGNGYNYHEIDIYEIFQNGGSDSDGFHRGKKGNYWRYSCGKIKDLGCPEEERLGANVWAYIRRGKVFRNWVKSADLSKDFFIFAAEWSPEKISYFLNNACVYEIPNNTELGLNQLPMQVILNNVTLGDKKPNKKTKFPSVLETEYVRVYKKESDWKTLFQTFPKNVCANNSWNNFVISDFYPDATYSLSSNNPNIQTKFWTNEWGNVGSFFIPNTLAEGTYNITLSIKFANDSIRNISQNVFVSSEIPAAPLSIDSLSENCHCIFRPYPFVSTYKQAEIRLANGEGKEIAIWNENACGKSAAIYKEVSCHLICEDYLSPKRSSFPLTDEKENTVFIYPNLIDNQILNIYNSSKEEGVIYLFDTNGSLVFQHELNTEKNEFFLPFLATGLYYGKIICGKQIKQEKIVILPNK